MWSHWINFENFSTSNVYFTVQKMFLEVKRVPERQNYVQSCDLFTETIYANYLENCIFYRPEYA